MADERRAELLEGVCAHLLAQGLGRSSLREIGAAVGTSDRMLLYYFRDKAELMGAALDRLAAVLEAQLDALRAPEPLPEEALRERLVAMALDDAVWPFMQLWLEVVARSARGDPLCRDAGGRIGAGFLRWVEGQVAAAGEAERRGTAARVLATVEGAIVLKGVGIG